MTPHPTPSLPRPVRLPATAEIAARQSMIDTANAEMVAAKTAALAAYEHRRSTPEAHRELVDQLSTINGDYQAALPRMD